MSSVSLRFFFFFLPPTVDPDKWNPLQRFNTPVMFIFPAKMFPGQVDLVGFLIVREFSETRFDICFKSSITMQCTIVIHTLQILVRFFPIKRATACVYSSHTGRNISHIMTFSFQNVDQCLSLNGAHTLPSVCVLSFLCLIQFSHKNI